MVINVKLVNMQRRGYLHKIWSEFNEEKNLILVSGPRQAGKTTFAKDIASKEAVSLYFNYDIPANKAKILTKPTFFEEVDFLVTENANPLFMVEAKLSETSVSPHLVKFQNILHIPAIQLINPKNVGRKIRNGHDSIVVASAANWLSCLN